MVRIAHHTLAELGFSDFVIPPVVPFDANAAKIFFL
jgi:hypothetical protein